MDRQATLMKIGLNIIEIRKIIGRFIGRRDGWSIGIYAGNSPCNLTPLKGIKNPVLKAKNVTDRNALFVADPFMINEQGIWYMFFEVLDRESKKGEIGLATSSDGRRWVYQKIVLSEQFHLSYPYVFKWQNEIYMIPESHEAKAIRLYKAVFFPHSWEFVGNLITGFDYIDSSVFNYNNRWWMFTCPTTSGDTLKLFYSSDLKGPWQEHPANPIIKGNAHIARCGGRVIATGDKIIRFTQDNYLCYGNCLRAFEITKLTSNEYEEKEYFANPLLMADRRNWNKLGMHTIDPHQLGKDNWIACVDGNRGVIELR